MKHLLLALMFFLCSCKSGHQQSDKSCDYIVKQLLIESGFRSSLVSVSGENGTIAWMNVATRLQKDEEDYFLQLYFNNEDGRDVTIAWLKILPRNNIIIDVTYDDMYPDTLNLEFDISALKANDCLP